MKKNLLVIFIGLILASCVEPKPEENKEPNYENTLVLLHPTKYNLKLTLNLLDKGILDLPNLKIIGIYHKYENYDFSESEDFLKENLLNNIELIEVTDTIYQNVLYKENDCSDDYKKVITDADGIIFFGGPDMPPAAYGEETSLRTGYPDSYRHYFELSFLFHLLGGSQDEEFIPLLDSRPNFPVLGICLGMQTMNVACGGTMYQDIPSEIYNLSSVEELVKMDRNKQHRNYYNNLIAQQNLYSGYFHEISIQENILTKNEVDEAFQPFIYSNHHQAIEKLGLNLRSIATSVDGKIIEAIAHNKFPNVIGVQFHPEGTYLHNEDEKYKTIPNAKAMSGKEILEQTNSYQFHLDFWARFSESVKE